MLAHIENKSCSGITCLATAGHTAAIHCSLTSYGNGSLGPSVFLLVPTNQIGFEDACFQAARCPLCGGFHRP